MSRAVKVMAVVLLVVVVALSFGAGYTLAGRNRPALDTGLELVAQAWDTIFNNYVGRDELDADTMSQAAIGGMLEALDDPYSSYLDAEVYQLGLSSLEGKIEGIGAEVSIRDKQLVIVARLRRVLRLAI